MLNLLKSFIFLFVVFYSFEWISSKEKTKEEREIELNTNKMVTKSCCPNDFINLVLTKWDECLKMNCWQFNKEPIVECRKEMFNRASPDNKERKAKCNERKDEWLDCVDKMVIHEKKESGSALKPEYQNNNTLIQMLPLEKLLCFQRALADITCTEKKTK